MLDLVLDLTLILYNNQDFPLQSSKLTSILKMRKRNITHSNYQHCCICLPIDDQVISITDSLYHRIEKAMGQVKEESAEIQCSKLEPLDFTRLIKIVFNKRFKNLKVTATCKHNELKKAFMTKLGCSNKDIDKASSVLCWKVAKFNFHTDIVILQSKSFLRHLVKPQEKQIKPVPAQIEKSSSAQVQKLIKQQNQQRCPEQIILENSINLTRLTLGDKISEIGMNQYAYIWPFSWPTAPMLFTHPQYTDKQVEQNNQIATYTKFQEQ